MSPSLFGTCAWYHDLHLQVYKRYTATHACVKKTGQSKAKGRQSRVVRRQQQGAS